MPSRTFNPFGYNIATFGYIGFLITAELCSIKKQKQ